MSTPSDEPQRVEFEIGARTVDEQEADARQLAPYHLADVDQSDWTEQSTHFGVRLRLPRAFEPHDSDFADLQLWHAADGSMFLITRHAGDGRAATMIALDAEPASTHTEGLYSIQLGGRMAPLSLARMTYGDRDHYYATVDAGIRPGFGLGVAMLATSREHREELIAAIGTIKVTD